MDDLALAFADNVATKALYGYLAGVDMQLQRSGMVRADRDATCQQIIEQFYDLLDVPAEEANVEQVDAVLGQLSSELDYACDDIASPGQMLRMYWGRFWNGPMRMPVVFNDNGRRRIMWSCFIHQVLVFFLGMLPIYLVLLKGYQYALLGAAVFAFLICLLSLTGPKEIELLPRVEHWQSERFKQRYLTDLLLSVGPVFFIFAVVFSMYWLVCFVNKWHLWPIDRDVFLATMMSVFTPWAIIVIWNLMQRQRQMERWVKDYGGQG